MASYKKTDDGYIEIKFDSIPSYEVRSAMKALRFQWNKISKVWSASSNVERLLLADKICNGNSDLQASGPQFVSVEMNRRCCYCNSVEKFLSENVSEWVDSMKSAFSDEYVMHLGESQIHAWKDCFKNLQAQLPSLEQKYRENLTIIFEYALPYESGRRPDVILLNDKQVIILEYKMKPVVLHEDEDQVAAYARDLGEYHVESRDKEIIPVLVLTRTIQDEIETLESGVTVCPADILSQLLAEQIAPDGQKCDAEQWMNSACEPLPTIVDAARTIMKKEPLPNIRRVNSTCIPQAISFLANVAKDAKENGKHVLALVTGVPGAGKTLLGLNFVYDACESNENANSVYLSGNGPLIKVLQDALKSKVFVQDVHTVVNEFVGGKMNSYNKNIIVFDEGQRAWDRKRMEKSRNTDLSEPDVFVKIADSLLDWSVLLILVGEGQEINQGEHGGIGQWNVALDKCTQQWEVVCPQKLEEVFADKKVTINNDLDLNTSLRSSLAGEVSNFVNRIISGDIDGARSLLQSIKDAHFDMYITRDLELAKTYCKNRYAGSDKRYGLMASSKAYSLSPYGMRAAFRPDVAAWFNKQPHEYGSCCTLKTTISEFDCQGLEVDFPIIGWGTDMLWNENCWKLLKEDEDADEEIRAYRLNSYRVLLTRGRDGFIIFIPEDNKLETTYELFKQIGLTELSAQ